MFVPGYRYKIYPTYSQNIHHYEATFMHAVKPINSQRHIDDDDDNGNEPNLLYFFRNVRAKRANGQIHVYEPGEPFFLDEQEIADYEQFEQRFNKSNKTPIVNLTNLGVAPFNKP